jgi:hypothetical protein
MKKLCLLGAVMLLLAGCGGGGDHVTVTTGPELTDPEAVKDVFLARVEGVILNTRDDAEPVSADDFVASSLDNQEPYGFAM